MQPDVRFGVAPHPVVDPDDPATYQNVMYSFGWVVNANADPEQQQLAQEFLAFILGKKGEADAAAVVAGACRCDPAAHGPAWQSNGYQQLLAQGSVAALFRRYI